MVHNAAAIATFIEGETVLDLSCGPLGTDVLLAAHKVGPTGRVVGLDASEVSITSARAEAAKQNLRPPRVAYVKTVVTAEPLPIEPGSVDCVFSSAISPELSSSFRQTNGLVEELYRVLRPGGRISSHVIMERDAQGGSNTAALSRYLGSTDIIANRTELRKIFLEIAGFSSIEFHDTTADLSVYKTSDDEPDHSTDINGLAYLCRVDVKKDGIAPSEKSPTVLLQWWHAYPPVVSSPPSLTAEEVAALIRDRSETKAQFAVVDVRRNDHAGGHVRGSYNRVAQTFHDDLPSVFEEFKNTPTVIFYCQSSNGRGPRCAGWYQDYLDSHPGEHTSKAYVLKGGIKNWLATFKGEEDLIDHD